MDDLEKTWGNFSPRNPISMTKPREINNVKTYGQRFSLSSQHYCQELND